MSDNKLHEERKARTKQLEDMEQMQNDLMNKLKSAEQENIQLETKIKELEDTLEVKSGKLDYILEEKEALFNKLQLAISENKEYKNQKANKISTIKKGGLFSSLVGYFKQDNFENIDVTEGKVKKNEFEVNSRKLIQEFNQPQSFFSNNSEFDPSNLSPSKSLTVLKLTNPIPETEPADHIRDNIEDPVNSDEGNENQGDENVKTNEHEVDPEENEEFQEEEEQETNENIDDQSEDMLKIIRENFNILP